MYASTLWWPKALTGGPSHTETPKVMRMSSFFFFLLTEVEVFARENSLSPDIICLINVYLQFCVLRLKTAMVQQRERLGEEMASYYNFVSPRTVAFHRQILIVSHPHEPPVGTDKCTPPRISPEPLFGDRNCMREPSVPQAVGAALEEDS